MATYDNKHWLLSNIRNSFISTDDTGMCEIVMAGENFPKLFYTKAMEEKSRMRDVSPSKTREVGMTEIPEDGLQREIVTEYDPYPDMEDSEEEDFPEDSYIRNNDMPHRYLNFPRSNTTQWRDKKEQAMRKAAKIKVIKWETPSRELTDEERSELFTRKELKTKPNIEKKKSLLADQLEKCPHLPHRQYLEYAKFDGTAQTRLNIKTFKIFMTILSEEHQNYPVIVCIIGSAKIIDLIGFTCYKYSIEHPEITLGSVHSYGLCIAEDDGEVDFELPYLDANEPCSKFNFSCLGLVDLKSRSLQPAAGSIPDHSGASGLFGMLMYPKPGESGTQNMSRQNTGDSGTSEAVANAIQAVSEDKKGTNGDTEQSNIMAASVPQYKAYKVQQLHKLLPNTPVRLVVSLDSIEVEPQPQSGTNKLLSRARFFVHSVDTVAWCQVTEAKSQRSTFRLVYSRAGALDRHADFFSPSSTYKHHDFECDHETAKEIVDKINRILDLRNSPCRREYKSAKDRKQQTRRSFQHPRHINYS